LLTKKRRHRNEDIRDISEIKIKSAIEVWMDIMTRKADGLQICRDQKGKVYGDLSLMIALFKKPNITRGLWIVS
jgi:hypothetical protein